MSAIVQEIPEKKVGAVLVVGAGISGMQSALDLAEAGFKVYLIERKPSIAGTMPMLDKTFPTNDCSMCILSPRVVDVGGHMNIEIMTMSELVGLEGWPGNFKATVKKHPRYVDINRCVGCGRCETVCPQVVSNDFNQGLDGRKAIYKPYAQAFPNAYVIDRENCIQCGACVEKCGPKAINQDMTEEDVELEVGAVVLAPGFEIFDARLKGEYGYGIYPNVVTSLQFERLLSASGPNQGHLIRPSDGKEPQKVAFIQCVGSREPGKDRNYCSGVCCMYATKEAIVAQEHTPGLEASIFCIDVRAFGKGFEQYYDRARNEYGIRYVKCLVSSVKELQQSKNLLLRYRTPSGEVREEEFDLVVLSVGLRPSEGTAKLAGVAGIGLDEFGFCLPGEETCTTTRPGVFVAGTFAGPKDIPETVIEASAAAGYVSRLLGEARGTLTACKEDIPERDVAGEQPRIGVFVCNCGINIGSVINIPEVVKYAKTLKDVAFAEEFLFACAQDSLERIKRRIKGQKLNRVVVASCTPRTHAALFQNALQESGLNLYLYEHVNIREHSSWVHREEGEAATVKAMDLIRMAVAKARLLEPIATTYTDINRQALVVGGGAAGLAAALSLAEQGFKVSLVEKSPELGGRLRDLRYSVDGSDPAVLLESLVDRVNRHPAIEVFTGSKVVEVGGYPGNYSTRVDTGGEIRVIEHGSTVIATGAREVTPAEYLYGQSPHVLTQTQLENRVSREGLDGVKNVVMIQCVGSRDSERPYCSRICCTHAIKNALKIKEVSPDTNVYILYRDVRVYGIKEKYYTEARRKGVIFIRYEPEERPVVTAGPNGAVEVRVKDRILGCTLVIDAGLLALSTGVLPGEDNEKLSQLFKVPLSADGFLLEAHMKLRPVDFAADGLYLCGLAHSPKLTDESIVQANAAAMRAVTLLSKDQVENVALTATVDEDLCAGCGLCVKACSYNARQMGEVSGVAEVVDVLCQGCGACVVACPSGASQQKGFEKGQMITMIKAALL
ncbi:MAG: FAD-dependent oxidoreductase [Bacillota bacterium]